MPFLSLREGQEGKALQSCCRGVQRWPGDSGMVGPQDGRGMQLMLTAEEEGLEGSGVSCSLQNRKYVPMCPL